MSTIREPIEGRTKWYHTEPTRLLGHGKISSATVLVHGLLTRASFLTGNPDKVGTSTVRPDLMVGLLNLASLGHFLYLNPLKSKESK